MKNLLSLLGICAIIIATMTSQVCAGSAKTDVGESKTDSSLLSATADTVPAFAVIVVDSITRDTIICDTTRLTDADYRRAADSLGCEVAAIKAVVDIEAGASHEGFYEPGKPIANFDVSVYRRFASKRKINAQAYKKFYKSAPRGQANVWSKIYAAMKVDRQSAIEGTFWGMFQIGGFNWSKCGCVDIEDFYHRMCASESEQLMLFVNFIKTTKLDSHLRNKNWASFSRSYNGPSYAARGYHTRMAAAYSRHKKEDK